MHDFDLVGLVYPEGRVNSPGGSNPRPAASVPDSVRSVPLIERVVWPETCDKAELRRLLTGSWDRSKTTLSEVAIFSTRTARTQHFVRGPVVVCACVNQAIQQRAGD